ncbi:hypothetical protein CCAX7_34960 [Capsulimonas corticalis]|uniref:Uncharacterized protein n=1 Tax=Capsulimonas corticalis TaxID=2219043 RepID=A0A402CY97_9BACT|nr:AraC family transcriptional regulator [Capsulimonas corticalis]BDI31445.1 hypothetical protein CCAX7_34960 [Capsulimonas corticalis]
MFHLSKEDFFGDEGARLFVSDPVMEGNNYAHDHDFLEIVLVASGTGAHISIHGAQTLKRGDLFVLRLGAWHEYLDCQHLHVYNCCCAPQFLRRDLALLGDDPAVSRLLWLEPLAPRVRGVLHCTLTEEQTQRAVAYLNPLSHFLNESFTVRAGRLLVLLGYLGQCVYPNERDRKGGLHAAVREGIQQMEDSCDEEWDLTRLAELTRLNPSYLTRLFKAATGRSPMQYLTRHRAELAASLLVATDHPIGEIGARVGWRDPNYFARRFKAVFGVTPSAYRSHQAAQSMDAPQRKRGPQSVTTNGSSLPFSGDTGV